MPLKVLGVEAEESERCTSVRYLIRVVNVEKDTRDPSHSRAGVCWTYSCDRHDYINGKVDGTHT